MVATREDASREFSRRKIETRWFPCYELSCRYNKYIYSLHRSGRWNPQKDKITDSKRDHRHCTDIYRYWVRELNWVDSRIEIGWNRAFFTQRFVDEFVNHRMTGLRSSSIVVPFGGSESGWSFKDQRSLLTIGPWFRGRRRADGFIRYAPFVFGPHQTTTLLKLEGFDVFLDRKKGILWVSELFKLSKMELWNIIDFEIWNSLYLWVLRLSKKEENENDSRGQK